MIVFGGFVDHARPSAVTQGVPEPLAPASPDPSEQASQPPYRAAIPWETVAGRT